MDVQCKCFSAGMKLTSSKREHFANTRCRNDYQWPLKWVGSKNTMHLFVCPLCGLLWLTPTRSGCHVYLNRRSHWSTLWSDVWMTFPCDHGYFQIRYPTSDFKSWFGIIFPHVPKANGWTIHMRESAILFDLNTFLVGGFHKWRYSQNHPFSWDLSLINHPLLRYPQLWKPPVLWEQNQK